MVEVPRFRGLGTVDPSGANEVTLESRWALPIIVAFQTGGTVYECSCAIQEVTRGDDGLFRYRIKVIAAVEAQS